MAAIAQARRRRHRTDWEQDEEGNTECASISEPTGQITCGEPASGWMRCPATDTESPVCTYHRGIYERGRREVTCLACLEEHVRISEHYEYSPLDSPEPPFPA